MTVDRMRFWRLAAPDYKSDYKHSYVNGSLEHPFGLPGVHCDVCGQTWGGSRILPWEYPQSLRGRKKRSERWPVPLLEHQALLRTVQDELARTGVAVDLRPGDCFQPCLLDIPSFPTSDFLWCSIGSVVVSARVRSLVESLGAAGVTFSPVTPRKIGKKAQSLRAPVPESGEPEDIIDEVPLLDSPGAMSPYFEMLVSAESGWPPGGEPTAVCPGCGRETIDYKRRRLVMLEPMWRGHPIFHLATTLNIVITDPVRKALEDLGATNVQFSSYGAAA